jgi:carbonic anhydrase
VTVDGLLEGYRRFRAAGWPERRRLFEALADQGQRPRAMVVACADSRVDPGMIFDAGPGELFIVRNIAALVPPYAPDGAYHGTSAALEFGVRVLEVRDLVVLGHGLCGGVHGLLHGVPDTAQDFVASWLAIAASVRVLALACDAPAEQQLRGEHEVVKLSLANLRRFPWIAERELAGHLTLHGAHFDVRTGLLALLGADGRFAAAGD